MPHQCTGCGERFEDGSKEMLSGCPECGGNKFQFRPKGADFPEDPEPPEPAADEPPADPDDGSVAETVGRASARVRDFVASSDDPDPNSDASAPDPNATWPSEAQAEAATDHETDDGEIIDADARRSGDDAEDAAQASARSGLATSEDVTALGGQRSAAGDVDAVDSGQGTDTELGTSPGSGRSDSPPAGQGDRVVSEPSPDDPDISELREQLNDQFESIKIVEPGEYELNLMELYDREEYIIALQENGRYVIQVPDQWIGSDLDDR